MFMKKLHILFTVLFSVCLFGCPNPENVEEETPVQAEEETSAQSVFTLKNESSYDLTDVTWAGVSFALPGSSDLLKGTVSRREVAEDSSGYYIYFTRKDRGIRLRTYETFIKEQSPVTIENTIGVLEIGNENNKGTLAEIGFLPAIALEYNGVAVAKNDTVSTIETPAAASRQIEFVVKNTGSGALTLSGVVPVGVTAGAFSVTQPSASTIAPGGSLPFKITFTPPAVDTYTTAVTVKSNDPAGDFIFAITGTGVSPKPAITIWHEEDEIVQNGTVDLGEVIITQSKTAQLYVKNTGTIVLNVESSNITISGADAAAFSILTLPAAAISAGNESAFTVQFTPVSIGEQSAVVTIPNDDDSRNSAVFIIKGTGKREYPVLELKNDATVITNNSEKNFGRVEIGQTKIESFGITNTGLVDLLLSGDPSITPSSGKFSIITMPQSRIGPNETAHFAVKYTPDTEQPDEAEITISDNTQSGLFKFRVKGTGYIPKEPEIVIEQGTKVLLNADVFNFGSSTTIEQKTVTFTITNTGDADLILSNNPAVYLLNDNSNAFSITLQPGISIAPNETSSFAIRFSPAVKADNITANVIIRSNSKTDAEFSFQVTGTSYQIIPVRPSISSVTGDIHTVTQNVGAGIKNTYYPITASWTASPGAEEYRIYYSTTETGFSSGTYATVTNATSATILSRRKTQYKYIKISALNGAGESEPTAVRVITQWTTSSASHGSGSTTR
jgi:hypothetical protein